MRIFQAFQKNVQGDSTTGTLLNMHLHFSFIQQYLLSTYYMTDIILSAEDTMAEKTG